MTAEPAQDGPARLPRPRPLRAPDPEPEPVSVDPVTGWARYEPEGMPVQWRHPDWPNWYAWRGVADVGYYARRPMSSPPLTVGPKPGLAALVPLMGQAEADRHPR